MTPSPQWPQRGAPGRAKPANRARKRLSAEQRWVLWITFTIVALLVVVLGAYWIDEQIGWRRWEAYKAEAALRGTKLRPADFEQPPPVAPEENFWAAPFFQKDVFGNYATLKIPWNAESKSRRNLSISESLMDRRSAFVRARLLTEGDPRGTRELLEQALESFSESWQLFCEAAARPGSGSGGLFYVHAERLKEAANVCRLRVELRLAAGRAAQPAEEWLRLRRLRHVLAGDAPHISTKLCLDRLALESFRQGWREKVWTEGEYAAIARAWLDADPMTDFVQMMEWLRVSISDHWLTAPDPFDDNDAFPDRWENFSSIPHSLVRYHRWIDELLGEFDLHAHRFTTRQITDRPNTELIDESYAQRSNQLPFFECRRYAAFHAFGYDVEIWWRWFKKKALTTTVQIDQARVVCALERYRFAQGAYPENLAALVPRFLTSVPHDIFDGKPLRYRCSGTAFVLYSIGPNATDENGVPSLAEKAPREDWIWDENDW